MKALRFTFDILCLTPYVYIIAFYSFVVRATIKLGYIPSYNQPDPGTLHFDTHDAIVTRAFDVAFFGSILVLIIWLLLAIMKQKAGSGSKRVFLIGVSFIVFHLFFDPFFEWAAD